MANFNIEDADGGFYNKPLTKFVSTCEGIVQSGKRKGEICGCNTVDFRLRKHTFCKRHDGTKKKKTGGDNNDEEKEEEEPLYMQFDPQEKCSICLEEFGDMNNNCKRLVKCAHLFHRSCIMKWVQMDKFNCPVCRDNMSVYTMYIIE
jgi:hypothetical protein